MAGSPTLPDWEAIERAYRAGLLSIREIASTQGITHGAINKRAKRDGWDRDLKAKIQAKADALVSKQAVSNLVSKESMDTERMIVSANAEVIADVRLAHRKDIGRSRRLTNKLLDELEGLTDNNAEIAEIIDQLRDNEDADTALLDLCKKMSSLPNRTKVMKELSETLKTLIGLERQAYGLDVETGDKKMSDDLLREIAERLPD
jgi:hypothetical protein